MHELKLKLSKLYFYNTKFQRLNIQAYVLNLHTHFEEFASFTKRQLKFLTVINKVNLQRYRLSTAFFSSLLYFKLNTVAYKYILKKRVNFRLSFLFVGNGWSKFSFNKFWSANWIYLAEERSSTWTGWEATDSVKFV